MGDVNYSLGGQKSNSGKNSGGKNNSNSNDGGGSSSSGKVGNYNVGNISLDDIAQRLWYALNSKRCVPHVEALAQKVFSNAQGNEAHLIAEVSEQS